MQGLLNAMRLQAQMQDTKVVTMLGTIFGYNPNNYTAKVMLQPDNIETENLPIASPWVGNGWGLFCPPTDGDVVAVHFQEGDISSGIIDLRLFTAKARPASVPSGEFQVIHKSGSALKFHNDGTVQLIGNGTVSISAPEIDLIGAGGTQKGIVQADCVCAFTGQPHAMVSASVKGTI